jgi:hypothetical protein
MEEVSMTTIFLPALHVRTGEQTRPACICPMCGQLLPLAPAPFVVLVRIDGQPFRLADPLHIGGRKIYADGRYRWLKRIPIVRVQA